MADYSHLLVGHATMPNQLSGATEAPRIEKWTDTTTWGNLPTVVKKVRTHGAVTANIPYMFGPTSTYPCGLTAVPATNPKTNIIVFEEAHAAAGYYEGVVAGYVVSAVTSGTVAANDCMQVINAGVSFIDDGANAPVQTADTCAIALTAAVANVTPILMSGVEVAIAAT